jgi:hypothetical protein
MSELADTPKNRLLRHADYLDRCGRRTLAADLRSWVEVADPVLDARAGDRPDSGEEFEGLTNWLLDQASVCVADEYASTVTIAFGSDWLVVPDEFHRIVRAYKEASDAGAAMSTDGDVRSDVREGRTDACE